ncbi:MAG: tRNA glutamyl-Q(34) synthetase GluQRS [Oscillospiraceae bacterium]
MTGRFAPSPSGRMHLGNVFSALLAWLSVRSCGGTMVLRIEDLDPARCRAEYADQVKRDLTWLGLDWDVEQTPQSLRAAAYRKQFERLAQLGLVYPCYCSRNELLAASAPHASDGQAVYPGTCRYLSQDERGKKQKMPSWRVMVPDETVSFLDGLQGEYHENLLRGCGDFIIRRADGVYAYQLAVVTDDAQAGVTQVVRGRDLLSSVPRQMYLQRMLGFQTPRYYHVPLLVAPDGRRLSKRERDLDLGALQERFTPEQLVGWLSYLAGLQDAPVSVRAKELAAAFDWRRVQAENIVVDSVFFH